MTDIGSILFLNKTNHTKPPVKKKEQQDQIQGELKVTCDNFKCLEITDSWEKWKYVMPIKLDLKKNPFCTSSEKISLNYVNNR